MPFDGFLTTAVDAFNCGRVVSSSVDDLSRENDCLSKLVVRAGVASLASEVTMSDDTIG